MQEEQKESGGGAGAVHRGGQSQGTLLSFQFIRCQIFAVRNN